MILLLSAQAVTCLGLRPLEEELKVPRWVAVPGLEVTITDWSAELLAATGDRTNLFDGFGVGVGSVGVTLTALDAAPAPTVFTARSLMLYVVALVSPVIEIGDVAAAGSRVVQLVPPSVEYS